MDRLRKRREFLAVATGHKWAAPGLVLQARAREQAGGIASPDIRVGFTVTKKVGSAVIRNRAKRRLRAAAAELLPILANPGYDYVLVGRAATLNRAWPDLLSDLRAALERVHGTRGPASIKSSTARDKAPHG
ncbi:MAG: ribonuclease P protein component [Parvibaculum sp.]